MKQTGQNRIGRGKTNYRIFLLLLIVSFAVSVGVSYIYFKEKFTVDSDFIADIEKRKDKAGEDVSQNGSLRLYEADRHETDDQGGEVLRKDTLLVVAEDVIRKYVEHYKVRLLDLYMDKEGVIYIDFGDELKKNFRGDALEELKIIAGLFNSIKSTIPGFTALKIIIEGKEDVSFGGHIDISKPMGEEIAKNIR